MICSLVDALNMEAERAKNLYLEGVIISVHKLLRFIQYYTMNVYILLILGDRTINGKNYRRCRIFNVDLIACPGLKFPKTIQDIKGE